MADSVITNKVWNIASVLMDAGVSNSDYLEQITFLLFLKMIDENKNTDEEWRTFNDIPLPEGYTWGQLNSKSGQELKDYYENMLSVLSKQNGMIGEIYQNAQNKIQTPVHLKKVISMINSIEWNTLSEDVKGDIYEGLLEKIAQDTKSGAGQYFTPRALINVIIRCVNPALGKKITAPCCGSGGFLLSAKKYLMNQNKVQEGDQMKKLKSGTFYGNEIVPNTYRLCLMNLLLHGIGEFGGKSPISCKDSLASQPSDEELSDYVLTNPPFGKKSSTSVEKEVVDKETGEKTTKLTKEREVYSRPDFIATTTNKQLNFIQHIKSLLRIGGTAAVVLPDNVLFEGGAGETIRKNLLDTCDLHTILRLPTGLFYAQGIKANVLFFEKKPASAQSQTKEVWIYDYRTNIRHTLKQLPLKEAHLQEFIECYRPDDRFHRRETYNAKTNPEGRWRKFNYNEIIARNKTNLDISWIRQENEAVETSLSDLLTSMQHKRDIISKAVNTLTTILGRIPISPITNPEHEAPPVETGKINVAEIEERVDDLCNIAKHIIFNVVNLAIQGKLLFQNPNDEPASVLLERIREKKKLLVREDKLKKKDLIEAPISKDEIPFEIPENW